MIWYESSISPYLMTTSWYLMRFTRKKFLYIVRKKIQDEDHYGCCPKCTRWHKKGDIVFGRSSKRYCLNCYVVLFGKHDIKKFITKYMNDKYDVSHESKLLEIMPDFAVRSQVMNPSSNSPIL